MDFPLPKAARGRGAAPFLVGAVLSMGGSSSLAMAEPTPAAVRMLCAVGARFYFQPAAGWGACRLTGRLNVSKTNVLIRVHQLIFPGRYFLGG